MKKIITRFAIVVMTLVMGLAAAAFMTQPAMADFGENNGYMGVCNSSASVSDILVYDGYGVRDWAYPLDPDECVHHLWNGNDNVRVDVEFSGPSDVDSYKIGEINVGYGPCHEDSENPASNPPNDYEDNGVRYRNYDGGGCYNL